VWLKDFKDIRFDAKRFSIKVKGFPRETWINTDPFQVFRDFRGKTSKHLTFYARPQVTAKT
jgi:hypothetical protein